MNVENPKDLQIYDKLKSPRLWFIIVLLIMIFFLWKTWNIWVNQNAIVDPNPRNKKEYHYETINNLNLITNTWQLYVSPIDTRKWRSQNISLLWKSIYIRMYNITDEKVMQKLKQLASDHNISIIYETEKHGEDEPTEDYKRVTNSLKNAGVNIYTDKQMWVNFTHAKTFVGENWFMIETMNLTKSSFDKNREFIFFSENKDIRDNLTYLFHKDLSGEKILASDIHPNLLICNIDCRAKLEYMIKNAKSSIYIYNQYIDDENIINLLKQKIQQKLDIKIILAGWDKDETNKQNFGASFKAQSNPYPHAKVLLIDNKYLIISSINFSTNSMNNNREIWTITMDLQAISKFKKIFEQDWNK